LIGTPRAITISGAFCAITASVLLYQQRQCAATSPLKA
jgi:hypothetical protein